MEHFFPEMEDGEEDGGNEEKRVPRSLTPPSSMGRLDGRKVSKKMLK